MASFRYTARTLDGELQTGVVEASSRAAAIAILQQHRLIITGLREVGAEKPSGFAGELAFFERVSRKDIVAFSRQLSVLLEADVPLLEALQAIADQTVNATFARAIRAIIADVEGGMALSDALGKFPRFFSAFYVNMVRSGEASGKLEEVFSHLAEYLEREYAVISKIRGAFYYPAFVLFALAIVIALMVFRVLPKILPILTESGVALPLATRALLGGIDFLRRAWWAILGIVAVVVALSLRLTRTEDGRAWRDAKLLRLPIVGGLVRALLIARFADNLSTLIGAGIPIVQALEVTSGVVGNAVFRELLSEAVKGVQRGEQLHETFRTSPLFPQTVVAMIAVGERTGKLETILRHIARFYSREVESKTAGIVSLIEPALIVLVGVGVGVFVSAILLPIYNLASGG